MKYKMYCDFSVTFAFFFRFSSPLLSLSLCCSVLLLSVLFYSLGLQCHCTVYERLASILQSLLWIQFFKLFNSRITLETQYVSSLTVSPHIKPLIFYQIQVTLPFPIFNIILPSLLLQSFLECYMYINNIIILPLKLIKVKFFLNTHSQKKYASRPLLR